MAASSSSDGASARAEAGEEGVIRAEDLAPSAFAAGDAASAAELAALGVKRADDLDYDEANLTALDSHPVDAAKLASAKKEKYLAVVAREGVQLLIRRIFALPYEATEDGPMAVLPRARTHIPRRLPVPETRPETKWERFAKEKGIKKTKRSRMVLDEQTGEWAPRWGYKVSAWAAVSLRRWLVVCFPQFAHGRQFARPRVPCRAQQAPSPPPPSRLACLAAC